MALPPIRAVASAGLTGADGALVRVDGRAGPGRVVRLAVVVSLVATACVGPALRDADYQRKAVASLEQVTSTVAGVKVALDASLEDRAFAAATAVNVRRHEDTVSWTHTAFASRQPPPGTDHIRAVVVPVLAEASSIMADVRIAANRTDREELEKQRRRLDELTGRIERVLGEVRG